MHNAEDGTLEEAYESLARTLAVKQDFQRRLIDGLGVLPGEHLDAFADRIVRELQLWRSCTEPVLKIQPTSDPGYDAGSYVDELECLTAEVDRLHSWAGLMSLLDEHYPAEVFTGSSGDPGPAIVFLTREVNELRI